VIDTTNAEECQDIVEEVCTETTAIAHIVGVAAGPEIAAKSGVVVGASGIGPAGYGAAGYGAAGLINHRIGKGEADPKADASYGLGASPLAVAATPVCHAVTRRESRTVSIQLLRLLYVLKYQDPQLVPDVPLSLTVSLCVTISKPVCVTVPRDVPKTVCGTSPTTHCETISNTVVDQIHNTRSVQE